MSTLQVNNLVGPAKTNGVIEMSGTAELNVNGTMSLGGDGQVSIPSGTTAQRPATPSVGMIRFNTQTEEVEIYEGTDSGGNLLGDDQSGWVGYTGAPPGPYYTPVASAPVSTALPYTTSGLLLYVNANDTNSYSGTGGSWVNISEDAAALGNVVINSGGSLVSAGSTGLSGFRWTSGQGDGPQWTAGSNGIALEVVFYNTASDTTTTYGRMLDWADTTISYGSYSTNQFRCWVNAGGGRHSGEFVQNSNATDYYDRWNHAILTYDKTNTKGYWNGQEIFTVAQTGNLETGNNSLVFANGDGYLYSGIIGMVRWYNRGLTPAEVATNYAQAKDQYNTP